MYKPEESNVKWQNNRNLIEFLVCCHLQTLHLLGRGLR